MSREMLKLIRGRSIPTPVDCGACPVNIACATNAGGTGYVFSCCRATGVEVFVEDEKRVYIIDCQKHNFEQNDRAKLCKLCPLCSGDIVRAVVKGASKNNYYVPTVHAKVSVTARLSLFREKAKAVVVKRKVP